MANTATTHELLRHLGINPPLSFELRDILGFKDVKFSLRSKATPFSIMTQNMALLTATFYNGTNREGAVSRIIERIRELSPDIVGLCEVFVDDEREQIRNSLKNIYPFFMEGPDTLLELQDGGCLLLSKHNILASGHIIYNLSVGSDDFSAKGVLYMRIKMPIATRPFEIFYTHAQDITVPASLGAPSGVVALYDQLDQLNEFVNLVADANNPTFIFGDLNIPGEMPLHYSQLITRLGNPVDLWLVAGHSSFGGFTFISDNNFYEDPEDNPHSDQRLDYILMRAGKRLVPILDDMKILRFKVNGRDLSDHFGLGATFEQSIQIDF